MKIGLDYHGVLDKYPEFFKIVIDALIDEGHVIHIVTGATMTDFFKDDKMEGIHYQYFYSVTDKFLENKVPYKIDEKGNPSFSENLWNAAKAIYCDAYKIDMMIDNSEIYGKFFTTPYILFRGIK